MCLLIEAGRSGSYGDEGLLQASRGSEQIEPWHLSCLWRKGTPSVACYSWEYSVLKRALDLFLSLSHVILCRVRTR